METARTAAPPPAFRPARALPARPRGATPASWFRPASGFRRAAGCLGLELVLVLPSPPAHSSRSQSTVPRAPIPIADPDTAPPLGQPTGTGSPKPSQCGPRGTLGLVVRQRPAAAPRPAGELHVPACSARGCPTSPCPTVLRCWRGRGGEVREGPGAAGPGLGPGAGVVMPPRQPVRPSAEAAALCHCR